MVKKHLKALTVPNTWSVKKKGAIFVARPRPGKSFELGMPLSLVFKNLLKYVKTTKEVKSTLMDKEVLIDGKRVKDPRTTLGLMDVLSIPSSKEYYRFVINKHNKLSLVPIPEKEANTKVCKVIGKNQLKGGKLQINLSDGRNILSDKKELKVGDSVLITLPKQEIKQVLSLEKGGFAYLIKGQYAGQYGVIEKTVEKSSEILIKTKEDTFQTIKDYVYVIGKEKPIITFENE